MIKGEMPVEKLIDCHHKEMNERVKSQLKILIKEIFEEDSPIPVWQVRVE